MRGFRKFIIVLALMFGLVSMSVAQLPVRICKPHPDSTQYFNLGVSTDTLATCYLSFPTKWGETLFEGYTLIALFCDSLNLVGADATDSLTVWARPFFKDVYNGVTTYYVSEQDSIPIWTLKNFSHHCVLEYTISATTYGPSSGLKLWMEYNSICGKGAAEGDSIRVRPQLWVQ